MDFCQTIAMTCSQCSEALPYAPREVFHEEDLRFCPRCQLPLVLVAGKYRLEKKLGEGGNGVVYLARHQNMELSPLRVIKFLKRKHFSDARLVERFRREIQITSSISQTNEHIVRIYDDFGILPKLGHFYVMEYLEGQTLEELLDKEQPSLRVILHILRQLCMAVGAAHRENVIHRDLKPANVFVTQRGDDPYFIKVMDFGLAKPVTAEMAALTAEGVAPGTPLYMSPEQFMGRPFDHRADLYAVGLVLYEMLTRQSPFAALLDDENNTSIVKLAHAHILDIPTLPSKLCPERGIPDALDQLTMRCIEKKPDDRFQSAAELLVVIGKVEQELFGSSAAQNIRDVMETSLDNRVATPLQSGLTEQAYAGSSEVKQRNNSQGEFHQTLAWEQGVPATSMVLFPELADAHHAQPEHAAPTPEPTAPSVAAIRDSAEKLPLPVKKTPSRAFVSLKGGDAPHVLSKRVEQVIEASPYAFNPSVGESISPTNPWLPDVDAEVSPSMDLFPPTNPSLPDAAYVSGLHVSPTLELPADPVWDDYPELQSIAPPVRSVSWKIGVMGLALTVLLAYLFVGWDIPQPRDTVSAAPVSPPKSNRATLHKGFVIPARQQPRSRPPARMAAKPAPVRVAVKPASPRVVPRKAPRRRTSSPRVSRRKRRLRRLRRSRLWRKKVVLLITQTKATASTPKKSQTPGCPPDRDGVVWLRIKISPQHARLQLKLPFRKSRGWYCIQRRHSTQRVRIRVKRAGYYPCLVERTFHQRSYTLQLRKEPTDQLAEEPPLGYCLQ